MYERELRIRREETAPRPSAPRPRPKRRRKRRRAPFLSWILHVLVLTGLIIVVGSLLEDASRNAAAPPYTTGSTTSGSDTSAGSLPSSPDQNTLPVKAVEPQLKETAAADDWRLTLVNPWNSLPDGWEPTLTQLTGGHAVDERCYPDLQDMMDACRAAGNAPLICSSYRTWEKQESLFANKVARLKNQGYSEDAARVEAAKTVAVPGTSEHQLGLAVDIVDTANQNLDESQENTDVQQWLIAHSWEYGFILRFPTGKSDITGIIYEPWHYRYVGKEAAKEIHEQGLCLEEYLENLAK